MDENYKFSKKKKNGQLFLDEIGILKWPVIFTPLFFMATLEMDPGAYDDPFFF